MLKNAKCSFEKTFLGAGVTVHLFELISWFFCLYHQSNRTKVEQILIFDAIFHEKKKRKNILNFQKSGIIVKKFLKFRFFMFSDQIRNWTLNGTTTDKAAADTLDYFVHQDNEFLQFFSQRQRCCKILSQNGFLAKCSEILEDFLKWIIMLSRLGLCLSLSYI